MASQRLEQRNRMLKQKVDEHELTIKTLRDALELANARERIRIAETTDLEQAGESNDEGGEGPLWDSDDNVYRCIECNWEVADGGCQFCATKYNINDDEHEETRGSVVTDHESLNPERLLAPRGDTPIVETGRIRTVDIPPEYRTGDREDEYVSLLSRGATRAMCEVFNLEFTEEKGIVAWADQDIFDAYSSPTMKKGHFWKIYLGRRIDLDADDLDGAQFIDDLLEEVILFPLRIPVRTRNGTKERWETVEETPGLWVTRPVANREPYENVQDSDDDEIMDTEEPYHVENRWDEEEENESDENWDTQADEDEDDAVADALNQEHDAMLDKPEEDQQYNGPVIRREEYDTADDGPGSDLDADANLGDVPGLTWPRNGVDANWSSDEADSESEAHGYETEHDADQTVGVAPAIDDSDCEMSSADSDFYDDISEI